MRKPLKLILILLLISAINTYAQNFGWAKQMGGASWDDGYSIAVDSSGNIYTAGAFLDSADFDPGVGIFNLVSNGFRDIFIQKLDSAGNFIWAYSIGGINDDICYSLTVDTLGNIFITGRFYDTVDFDPGPGSTILSSNGSSSSDIFIVKLNASGNFVWANTIGGTSDDYGWSISADDSGNVYTAGYFSGPVDFDPGPGSYILASGSIFILKLNSSGNFIWAGALAGFDINLQSLLAGSSGNIYVSGGFNNTVDFDPGSGTFNLISNGNADAFILKLDASGNFIWAKSFGGTHADYGGPMVEDAAGNVYMQGIYYSQSVDFDPGVGTHILTNMAAGTTDIFYEKLSPSGNFIWAKVIGGTGYDFNAYKLAIDSSGNIYSTGSFFEQVDFDPGIGTYYLTSYFDSIFFSYYKSIFILKLDSSGSFVWAKAVGGGGNYINEGYSIDINSSEEVYVTGVFNDIVDFDPGPGTYNLTCFGEVDIFILKLGSQVITSTPFLISSTGITQAFPNPFSSSTTISFFLFQSRRVSLKIFDVTGKLVSTLADGIFHEGENVIVWNATEVNAGIYILKFEMGENLQTEKLVVTK